METQKPAIITVGICPAWDVTCCADRIDWGMHAQLDRHSILPAGKALNISRALSWKGVPSTAAGLWGQSDYAAMQQELDDSLIDLRMTVVPGRTRHNITVIDTKQHREMHLRASCVLANKESLSALATDLKGFISPGSIMAFAGSLPVENLDDILSMIDRAVAHGMNVALDTSGAALKSILKNTRVYLIKPNLEELGELCNCTVEDTPEDILRAALPLCDRAEVIVVSRGARGAILICKDLAVSGEPAESDHAVVNTVGCGDFLLAGILAQLPENTPQEALTAGIQCATARAWGLTETLRWEQVKTLINVQLKSF